MTQFTLRLPGGYCGGPLFNEYGKRRSPILKTSRTHGARRRARERRATPAWVNRDALRVIYEARDEMNRAAGRVEYAVDHIVPLDGKLVCGLHVPHNLRIITKLENERKGWMTWPDMPMEQLELL